MTALPGIPGSHHSVSLNKNGRSFKAGCHHAFQRFLPDTAFPDLRMAVLMGTQRIQTVI